MKVLKWIAVGMSAFAAVLVLLVVGLFVWLRWGYYDELRYVEERFRELPGVTLLRAGGNEDITLEDLWAEIRVGDHDRIEFVGLTRHAFSAEHAVMIGHIAGLAPRVTGYGYFGTYKTATGEPTKTTSFAAVADFGPGGLFFDQVASPVLNVAVAVARYHDIAAVLANWPRCPAFKELQDTKGSLYRYCSQPTNESPCYPAVEREWEPWRARPLAPESVGNELRCYAW